MSFIICSDVWASSTATAGTAGISVSSKEVNFNMIFTSNKNPALWREDFNEDATLLCALDRIFDDATVFKLRGESFRGKRLETISPQTGKVKAVEPVAEMKE